jgi:hypothetical protein
VSSPLTVFFCRNKTRLIPNQWDPILRQLAKWRPNQYKPRTGANPLPYRLSLRLRPQLLIKLCIRRAIAAEIGPAVLLSSHLRLRECKQKLSSGAISAAKKFIRQSFGGFIRQTYGGFIWLDSAEYRQSTPYLNHQAAYWFYRRNQ